MADALTPQSQPQISPAPEHATTGGQITGSNQVVHMLARHRKLLLFTAGSLMLAGFIGLMLWSSEKPYRAVYAGMSEKDAAAVVESLQKEHIPYRLEGSGTVMVPADQVYQARLSLAGQGITPSGNTGFEVFDQNNEFGLSDFTRKINLQRALQGELARTIEVIPQITAARVHLVMPKESAFAERDRKASASVMLQISGGRHLPRKTVLAIQNLVAASIPELDRTDVTVVDSSGTLLSGNEKEAPMSEGQSMQEYQTRLERGIAQRITGMLEQIVGPGQAVVRVSSSINREYIEQNSTRYNPDEQVLRSQKSIQEKHSSTGAPAIPGGVPGMASNTPGANPVTADGSVAAPSQPRDQASRSETVNNYEISSTREHRIVPFGSIKKLSVAVIVGGHYTQAEDGSRTFEPRSKEELDSIRQLVERAMGYDENREDSLEVKSMPLVDISSRADSEALQAEQDKAFWLQIARYGIAALALILLALFVLRPLAKRIRESSEAVEAASLNAAAGDTHALSAETYQRLANMEQVRRSVMQEPDRASKVLREWVDPA